MAAGTAALRLENAVMRVEVDAPAGGAVTALVLKRAQVFPLIVGRGAGVAGCGLLFAPRLEVGGSSPRRWRMTAVGSEGGELALAGVPAAGLKWERRIGLAPGESRMTFRDLLRNESARVLTLRLGVACRQDGAPWRLTDRSWIGSLRTAKALATSSLAVPGQPVPPHRARVSAASFFWRQIGQYGTGLLYRFRAPVRGVGVAAILPGPDRALEVGWRSRPLRLRPGACVAWDSEVLLDEGGGPVDPAGAFGPVLVRADFAAAGRRGQPLTGFATVVSPQRRSVAVTVSGRQVLARREFDLGPGQVARLPVVYTPRIGGTVRLRVAVTDRGRPVGTAQCAILVDGSVRQRTWRTFVAPMPEEHYRGSWEEIGAQIARARRRIGGPTSLDITRGEITAPDNDVPFYRRHLPYYARLLEGMAPVLGAAPSELGLVKRGQRDLPVACMDVACYGPDGPINAFSKERDGPDYGGLGYIRVRPSTGYAFHVYMHHGVNAAGLTVSGATLNEDEATARAARRELERWKRSGRHTMPVAVGTWMLLAMCRNVSEALALIQSPAVPWEGTGNLLLLDRSGAAARVEAAGLSRRIFRHRGQGRKFFVAGNYPHERADGRFRIGARWGQAANTLLRERFLRDFAGRRQGRLGFRDVVTLMQSHEAGGMCQHHHDNPGQLYTVCSSLAVARTSELWLAQGPPCQVQYVRHALIP